MARSAKSGPTPLKTFFTETGVTQVDFALACTVDRGAVVPQPRISEWCHSRPSAANRALIARVTARYGRVVDEAAWRRWWKDQHQPMIRRSPRAGT